MGSTTPVCNDPFDGTVSPEAAAGDGAAAAAEGEAAEAGGSAGQEAGAGPLPSPQDEASGPRAGGGAAGGHEHPQAGAHAAHRRERGGRSAEGDSGQLRVDGRRLSALRNSFEEHEEHSVVIVFFCARIATFRLSWPRTSKGT